MSAVEMILFYYLICKVQLLFIHLAQVIIVIAFINEHLAMIYFKDPIDKGAKEVAVMAYEYDGSFEFL